MRLYNTLTRRIEELTFREPGRLGMYVCGPTVQEVPHFGHARAELLPDVLRRYLTWSGVDVFFVRNVTDVDDKVIVRAAELGVDPAVLADANTRVYDRQMARLGILPPDIAPRATGHIVEMIEMIERLVERGHAYELDGDVYFEVRSYPPYGRFSGRNLDELRSGARVEADERKRDPADFALWKAAKPGEPSWRSPWGRGRPGWHIECSAMADRYLGSGFDIHGGGTDLVFPHHENEVAQYEAATGEPFARHWVHNALLSLGGEKMSKSVGNVVTLDAALTRHGASGVRFFFLAAHYRSPLEVDEERLAEAASAVQTWQAFLRATATLTEAPGDDGDAKAAREAFCAAMDDDLSTPRAHAALFGLASAGHSLLQAGRRAAAAAARDTFLELTGVLGYDLAPAGEGAELLGPLVDELLAQRQQARQRRDFETADAIRARLSELGIAVEDTAEGSRWHLAGG